MPEQIEVRVALPQLLQIIFIMCFLAVPYVVMGILTHFQNGQSTRSQRAWIMVWLVFCQYMAPAAFGTPEVEVRYNISAQKYSLLLLLWAYFVGFMFTVGSFGGFVVVGKMILEDKTCINI